MKKYISVIVFFSLFVVGCSEQTSITSPENIVQTQEPNWIALPQASGMQVNEEWISSEKINGTKGGFLNSSVSYSGGIFGTVKIDAKLKFYRGAFPGTYTITMGLNDQNTSTSFGPSMNFNSTVFYNITYTGLDLSGIDPTTVKFVYVADDGTIEIANCEAIFADVSIGKLQVVNAVIPHFSRYGFVNKTY